MMPTLKEIRQRLGWAVDQLNNFIETAGGQVPQDPPTDSALYHVQTARAGLEEHITADSGDTTDGHTTDDTSGDSTDDTTTDDTSDTTDPEPEPSTGEPAVTFDPDQYGSTEELLQTADPFGGAELKEDGTQGRIVLDQGVQRPDGGTQAMRYDYIDQGIGNSLHVGRRMPFPSPVREVWVEAQVKWSPNFFAIQNFPDDGSTFAHKLLFAEAKAFATDPNWETSEGWGVNRWALLWPGGGSPNPPDGPVDGAAPRTEDGDTGTSIIPDIGLNAADYFDGNWHTLRLHLRHDPGLWELWIDGELVSQADGFTIHPEVVITAILLGRNKDDGLESGTESLWWGTVKAWTEDPGW